MNIQDKYNEYRKVAQDGDIMLWHGSHLLARIIRNCDSHYTNRAGEKTQDPAYYSHSSICMWGRGQRLQNADAWSKGITIVPMSDRINFYDDFCILRPNDEAQKLISTEGIKFIMDKWQARVKYDYFTLPRIALIKKTGIDISGLGKMSKFICSEFTQAFTFELGLKDYDGLKLFTPQDHIRFNNGGFKLMFEEKLK